MRNGRWIARVVLLAGLATVFAVAFTLVRSSSLGQAATWQKLASPGRLSAPHAFLENDCAACHTAGRGVQAATCVACHADEEVLLQRQPTAFHSDVASCVECHGEHQGIDRRPTDMDHEALVRIGLRQIGDVDASDADDDRSTQRLLARLGQHASADRLPLGHPNVSPPEATLDCATCHANEDRHSSLFGQDCAQCHGTSEWTMSQFRHPSPRSTDCAQCHQAPPSHYMEHFRMVSMAVADQPHAKVAQCYLCHQTTVWNDIKGVGFYEHH